MKPIKTALLLLLVITGTPAQSQTKNDITGIWTVTKIIVPDKMIKKRKPLDSLFLHTIFYIREEGSFKWVGSDFETARWTYDESTHTVTVKGTIGNGK